MKRSVVSLFICGLVLTVLLVSSSSVSRAQESVSFGKDIQPILESSCWTCHGDALQLSKLDLRARESALKGGEHGAAIVPGKADDSRLYRRIAGLEKPAMPMG